MERVSIRCLGCQCRWKSPQPLSDYERQAQESRPCPHCSAYTLFCVSAEVRQRRVRVVAGAVAR